MPIVARDIMTTSVVTVQEQDSIDRVIELMLRHHVSGLPVVDDSGKLLGVVSERDLLAVLRDGEAAEQNVCTLATRNPHCVKADASLAEMTNLLSTKGYRRLPVVDDENQLLGLVSRRDLLRFLRDLRARMDRVLANRRTADVAFSDPRR